MVRYISLGELDRALADRGWESDGLVAGGLGTESNGDVDYDMQLDNLRCDSHLDFGVRNPLPDLSDLIVSVLESTGIIPVNIDNTDLDKAEMKLKRHAYWKQKCSGQHRMYADLSERTRTLPWVFGLDWDVR